MGDQRRAGALGSRNLPIKRNLKRLSGLDAMTGASNFDICEAIWLKLLEDLAPQGEPLIALPCKTAVARNVLQFAAQRGVPVERGFVRLSMRRDGSAPRSMRASSGSTFTAARTTMRFPSTTA